ncbi:hypothetical protein SRHO_G00140590 [Serrasalmus rhombeus]
MTAMKKNHRSCYGRPPGEPIHVPGLCHWSSLPLVDKLHYEMTVGLVKSDSEEGGCQLFALKGGERGPEARSSEHPAVALLIDFAETQAAYK